MLFSVVSGRRQVDHATRGLRVDGRPFHGIGWYYPYRGRNQYATFDNQTQYIVHRQAPTGIKSMGGGGIFLMLVS